MTWQPIETAPTDGSWVLIVADWKRAPVTIGFWNAEWFALHPQAGAIFTEPTHWMPLPDPPT